MDVLGGELQDMLSYGFRTHTLFYTLKLWHLKICVCVEGLSCIDFSWLCGREYIQIPSAEEGRTGNRLFSETSLLVLRMVLLIVFCMLPGLYRTD